MSGRRAGALATALLLAACAPPPAPGVVPAALIAPPPPSDAGGDARVRFREVFCAVVARDGEPCGAWLWPAEGEPAGTGRPVPAGALRGPWRVVLVAGYGADCFAPWLRMFDDARGRVEALGVHLVDAPISGLSSGAWNTGIIARTVADLDLAPGERLALVGYSKGAPDILEALVAEPTVRAKADAVVSIHGALRGSPLAADAPRLLDALVDHLPGTACGPHDGGALDAMRPEVREAWLARHAGRWEVPLYVLAGYAERPRISNVMHGSWDALARSDPRNDGQVTLRGQTAPGAILLGHPRADHWAIALPIAEALPAAAVAVDRNAYPRGALLEALLRFLDEAVPTKPVSRGRP